MKILYKYNQLINATYKSQIKQISKPIDLLKTNKNNYLDSLYVVANVSFNNGQSQLWDLNRQLPLDCQIQFLQLHEAPQVLNSTCALIINAALNNDHEMESERITNTHLGFIYEYIARKHADIDIHEINYKIKEILSNQNSTIELIEIEIDEAKKLFNQQQFQNQGQKVLIYRLNGYQCISNHPHLPNITPIQSLWIRSAYQLQQNRQILDCIVRSTAKTSDEHIDHREIGKKQALFNFHKFAPGSVFFMNHGTKIYNKLIEFLRKQYRKRGYSEVISPQIYSKELWEQSGHMDKYAENIYMIQNEDMGMKPMNCPGHCLLFNMQQHSYKELPVRYADFGVLHRNEVHGSLSGLTRMRKFVQDDAHIFCRLEQIKQEIDGCLDFLQMFYTLLGFHYEIKLSTRPSKYIGSLETWEQAEKQLIETLDDRKLKYTINEGDGAFYGPKIDFTIKDDRDKEYQCATIQLDFNLPERFNLTYRTESTNIVDEQSHKQGFQRPVMIHRAILGSLERMIGILCEVYNGEWPFWLSPRQVLIIDVGRNQQYLNYVREQLKDFEIEVDQSEDLLGKRVRRGEQLKFNYIVIIGEQEKERRSVSVRERGNRMHRAMSVEEFKELLEVQIDYINKL